MANGDRRPKGDGGLRQRRDGAWEATLNLGVAPNGKRLVRSFRGPTRAAALARRNEALKAVARGEDLSRSRLTVADWMTHWLATTVQTSVGVGSRKPSTAQSYQHLFDAYIKHTIGRLKLQDLTIADVDAMTNRLAKAGYKPNTSRL